MSTTDSNGIVFLQDTDNFSPFHTLFNTAQTGTTNAISSVRRRGVYYVATRAAGNSLASSLGVSASNPLYVHRGDASAGSNLEYTTNGSTWTRVSPDSANTTAYARRPGDDSFGSGSFTDIMSTTLPAGSPAGRYNVDWFYIGDSTVSSLLFVRGMAGATNLTQDAAVNLTAGTRTSIMVPTQFDHAGGALPLLMRAQVSAGIATVRAGCLIRAYRVS